MIAVRRLGLALFATLALGCAHGASRGRGWYRLWTDHVELSTNLPPQQAVTAGWAFEDLHRALEHVFPCEAPASAGHVRVVMFRDTAGYDAVGPDSTGGFFRAESLGLIDAPAAIVVRPGESRGHRSIYTQRYVHELTHLFVARCLPNAPIWLNEGLAAYFETLRVGVDQITVGISPFQIVPGATSAAFHADGVHVLRFDRGRMPGASALMPMSPAEFYAGEAWRNYGGAWALVHTMMHPARAELRPRFLSFLAALPHAPDAGGLFARSFADVPLEDEVALHLDRPMVERHVTYTPTRLGDPLPVALPASEAHLLLALLRFGSNDPADRREGLAHAALAMSDPETEVRARLVAYGFGEYGEAPSLEAALDALEAQHPDDLDVLAARVSAEASLTRPTNRGRALMDALAQRRELRAGDLVRIAQLARAHHFYALALQLAERALGLEESRRGHIALAQALESVGRWEEAERERRASRVTVHRADEEGRAPSVTPTTTDPPPYDASTLPLQPMPSVGAISLAGRTSPTFRASALDPSCPGFVGAPVARIEVDAETPAFVLRTYGALDTVLVVEDGQGHFHCDDDSGGGVSSALLFPAGTTGPLVIRVGTYSPTPEVDFAIAAEVATDRPTTQGCALMRADYGGIGREVVLGTHTEWPRADGTADENWVPAMDAFVGRAAHVTAVAGVDAAGCSIVRVDVDEGRWLWRVRNFR